MFGEYNDGICYDTMKPCHKCKEGYKNLLYVWRFNFIHYRVDHKKLRKKIYELESENKRLQERINIIATTRITVVLI